MSEIQYPVNASVARDMSKQQVAAKLGEKQQRLVATWSEINKAIAGP